jgi:hypothetical protein
MNTGYNTALVTVLHPLSPYANETTGPLYHTMLFLTLSKEARSTNAAVFVKQTVLYLCVKSKFLSKVHGPISLSCVGGTGNAEQSNVIQNFVYII